MEKLYFWKTGEILGGGPGERRGAHNNFSPNRLISRKSTILRTLCFLVISFMVYYAFATHGLHLPIEQDDQISLHEPSGVVKGEVAAGHVETPETESSVPMLGNDEDISGNDDHVDFVETKEGLGKALEDEINGQEEKKTIGKEKATLLMLSRNREIRDALGTMRMIEDRFNHRYKYPWTFMNDEPFTDEFIRLTTGMASGPVEYVLIPSENWSVPSELNMTKIKSSMAAMVKEKVIYGGSMSYRHMCRFNSGFFYHQKALEKYDWYWRVEPNTKFTCDIKYDPFEFMRKNNKVYGWVISIYEFAKTIPTFWTHTKEFVKQNPQYLAAENSLNWLSNGANVTEAFEKGNIDHSRYNLCHFWSNFEIASLNFFRSEAYQRYFEYLDSQGGFYYERWGDAPVHSIGVGLFLPRDKIHHFSDIGYYHPGAGRCPQDDESHDTGRCFCDKKVNYDINRYSCTVNWFKLNGLGKGAVFPPQKKEQPKKQQPKKEQQKPNKEPQPEQKPRPKEE